MSDLGFGELKSDRRGQGGGEAQTPAERSPPVKGEEPEQSKTDGPADMRRRFKQKETQMAVTRWIGTSSCGPGNSS